MGWWYVDTLPWKPCAAQECKAHPEETIVKTKREDPFTLVQVDTI